ncbi:hypothetical protein [Streptomyces sp. cg40]|uniref:hypothetical protein n=1 Tax=Streptomyces sp. cg40 TaxID=3419764 RepID=UPI003D05CCD1
MRRTLVRASLERWFTQHEQGDQQGREQGRGNGEPEIPTRNQTRLGYTRTALEPLADTLPSRR